MNKKVVLNYVVKKFKLKKEDDINKKIFSFEDILRLAKDTNFIRKSICHLTKSKQKELIETSHLNKVERFVYSTYKNFYSKKQYELKKNNEFKKKITTNIIVHYIKTYFVNYKITKNSLKMINKMRHKAFYDAYKNNN